MNDIAPLVTFEVLGELGRFGNQLFQIAATLGAARANACACSFAPWPFEPYFAGPLPRAPAPLPPRLPLLESTFHHQPIVIREPMHLVGFFQSEKYFAHCAPEIRALLAPNEQIRVRMTRQFGALLARKPCSIHVRRQDYLTNPGYNQLWATDYYERAVRQFPATTPFLVFSDDIPWCRSHFTGENFQFAEGLPALGDFFLMSACAHHIIANSSFSWWAAWLNGDPRRQVVAPRAWFAGDFANPAVPFVAGPPHRGYHDTRDLIPEGWGAI